MKTLNLFLTVLFVFGITISSSAQNHDHNNMAMASTRTDTIKVWGNCDMCKARIEKAVKSEGATAADWSTKTKLLTVTYDPSKTNPDALSKKLASVGHDTEKYKAEDKVYNSLPACCKYERSK
jgi:copper chaperone CopZ